MGTSTTEEANTERVSTLKELGLNLQDIECFRYRLEDVLRSVTLKAIATLRAHELQRDLLRSKRLKEHFETNPDDAKALKNAFKSVQTTNVDDKHLKAIPVYFKPAVSNLTSLTAVEMAVMQLSQAGTTTDSHRGKRSSKSSSLLLGDFKAR